MKHVHHFGSFLLKSLFVGIFCLLATSASQAQHVYHNNFRTGVGFAYIVEGDNSGALFSQQYTREISDRLNFALSGEYLSSSRYDQGKKIFTSRKAFVMFDASVIFDLVENEKFTIKIGGGGAVRRRSEIDLITGLPAGGNSSASDYVHNRERDYGGKFFLENDFYNDNRLFFGGRATGYIYNAGSSIFALSLSMGYSF